jgi:hypothetical protein
MVHALWHRLRYALHALRDVLRLLQARRVRPVPPRDEAAVQRHAVSRHSATDFRSDHKR